MLFAFNANWSLTFWNTLLIITNQPTQRQSTINRNTHFNLQQNNFKFISFCFTWIPYNKITAEFWSLGIFFFLWLIIIINTNMNTLYTINTALSKGVESTTRHHSPLTTEYISFQHIYKSYSEREKETEVGGARGREKARCFYTAWIKESVLLIIYWRWTTVHPDEDCGSKTTNQDTSLTIWKTRSFISKPRVGSRTGVLISGEK